MITSRLTILLAVIAALTAAATIAGMSTVYAQFCIGCGASELAPGEEPKRPGWDPNDAPEDAPGQEAQILGPHCVGCAKDFAPGQEGLDLGIIGPPKKIQ
jgi:hypothetical protein